MKNFQGEYLGFWCWLVGAIVSGVIAPTIILLLAWIDIGFSSPDEISDGYIRAIGAMLMMYPILVLVHTIFFLISYYFTTLPKKIIEKNRIFKILGILYLCYFLTFLFLQFQNIIQLGLEAITMLFIPFLLMMIPLVIAILVRDLIVLFCLKRSNALYD